MPNWHFVIGIASGALQIVSIMPYIYDMVKGTTRPNIVSYIIWTMLQSINVAAQIAAGASWSVFLPAAMTFNTLLVTILCLRGYGYKEYGLLDKLCLLFGLTAIAVWFLTSQPMLALVVGVIADFIGTVPTIIKTFLHPQTEIPVAWLIMFGASVLALISTTRIDFQNIVFPIYYITTSGLIFSLAFFRKKLQAA